MEELLKELEAELESSKQIKYGSGDYFDGQESMLEQIIDRIKEKLKSA